MKTFYSSIRVIISLTIIAMGLQGLAVALISSDIYRKHAIDNHKTTIEKMVNIKASQLLLDLTDKARDLGLSQQQEPEFKSALRKKDVKALETILNSNFHRYFVTAGILKLEKIILLNQDFSILAESSEGTATLIKNTLPCSTILDKVRQSKGADRLKVKSGICDINEKTYHIVVTPVGGLSIQGYMVIITDPVNNLLSIGKDLGMSIRFMYGNGATIYQSEKWEHIKNNEDYLLTDYHLKTSHETDNLTTNNNQLLTNLERNHRAHKNGLHIEIIENIKPLYNKLPNTRALIITSASIITLIAIIIALIIMHITTLTPLSKITKQLSLIRNDKSRLKDKLEVKGTSEIRQLAISFNEMTSQMEGLYGKMEEMAYTDQLTNLPNRHMFNEKLHSIISNLQSSGQSFALLMMDLNKFKPINDSLGHKVGDKVLQEVGKRLKIVLRKNDNVLKIDHNTTATKEEDSIARLGGDEFTAIITDITNSENAKIVAEKIIHAMQETLEIDHHQLNISISIGIALCPQDADTDTALLHKADLAMYHAKNNQEHYAFYDETMNNI